MKKHTKLDSAILALLLTFALTFLATRIKAQDGDKNFRVGDQVEYRLGGVGEWQTGTITAPAQEFSGGLVQVVIRSKPKPYYPNGDEFACDVKNVRRITAARSADQPAADNTGAGNKTVGDDKNNESKEVEESGGVMTKQDIISWLRAHAYANGQPKIDLSVCKSLIELIKRRGVTEPLGNSDDPATKIVTETGCTSPLSPVDTAVSHNIGAPNTQNWLYGTWSLFIYSGANTYVNTAKGTAVTVDTGANAYFATIKSDGTYTWKVDSRTLLKDTWRKATNEEMGDRGGAGIVLHHGEDGDDWIVYKKFDWKDKADHVEFRQLKSTSRRIGTRR